MRTRLWVRSTLSVLLFLPAATSGSQHGAGAAWTGTAPVAAVVVSDQARFTVLTPRLVRVEWAADGRFEDRPSLVFVNRQLPVPAFTTSRAGGWITIDTGALRLRYRERSGAFAAANLSIDLTVAGRRVTWRPGMEDTGNLRGTTRTLDGVKGATSLEPGLISRDGWVVVDDSSRPLFDEGEWPWVIPREKREATDWYFFGHGRDYKAALGDFVKVAGRIPMPPRFAFGTWWSRYWSYTDQELMDLVREFEAHDVPLDVLVVDMDWHLTFNLRWGRGPKDQAGFRLGWSGYTWDRTLFPDPAGFLAWCRDRGLKTTLNLHPASGVQPHEEAYPEMARAMGIDPATKQHVPFDITDRAFTENYFRLLHHPLEAQGVDFWWLDWQQQPTTKVEGVNPTWWLNYVHTFDMERRGRRPLIFHRWGGLGNHRYQIGFSGDTHSVWESLAFQPYFTSTAANVGYAYWSHDIGGHEPGTVSPELYTRWVQFGVFSPILRTHTTKNPDAERRIWAYPEPYARVMRDAFVLRYALIPYLYTAARATYDTGVAFFRPLYYDWPDATEAYDATDQYVFGDELMVAPVTAPMDETTATASRKVWLPPGEWIEWSTGSRLTGPVQLDRRFGLEEIPVYARAGAVLTMQPPMRRSSEKPVDPLVVTVFPGPSRTVTLYEDEGAGLHYRQEAFARTTLRSEQQPDGITRVVVEPPAGRYPGMPGSRGYEMRLVGQLPPAAVRYEGREIAYARPTVSCEAPCWTVDGRTLTTIVRLPRSPVSAGVVLEVVPAEATDAQRRAADGFAGRIARLTRAMQTMNRSWPQEWSPESLVRAVQTPRRIELEPASAGREVAALADAWPSIADEVGKIAADPALVARALAQLGREP